MLLNIIFFACQTDKNIHPINNDINYDFKIAEASVTETQINKHHPAVMNSQFPELMAEFVDISKVTIPRFFDEDDYENNISVLGILEMSLDDVYDIYSNGISEGCPIVEESINGLKIEGGCTDSNDTYYEGTIVMNEKNATYNNFTIQSKSNKCPDRFDVTSYDGGVQVDQQTDEIEVVYRKTMTVHEKYGVNCEESTFYVWHVAHIMAEFENFPSSDNGTYSGDGTILYGYGKPFRSFDVITIDERIDEGICPTEPISGSNIVTNGFDELEFIFDGQTDCDENPTQMLSINGEQPFEVHGTSCSKMEQRQGWMFLVLTLLPIWIRQSKR